MAIPVIMSTALDLREQKLTDRAKTFSILLKACDVECPWVGLPSFLHKCHSLQPNSHRWQRIPRKRDGSFDTRLSQPEEVALGLEAVYVPSFEVLFVYHALPISLAFEFWIYWLNKHPNDLQMRSQLHYFSTYWDILGFCWTKNW